MAVCPQIPDIEDVLVHAVGALAAAPANVSVILDAAALEPLLEALTGQSASRAAAAAHAVGLLAREDDPRLSSLSPQPLQVCLYECSLAWHQASLLRAQLQRLQ